MSPWPRAKFEFVCKGCGATRTVFADVSRDSHFASHEISVIVAEGDAPSWQRVGDDHYCEKHKIETRRQLIIDGEVVSDIVADWGAR